MTVGRKTTGHRMRAVPGKRDDTQTEMIRFAKESDIDHIMSFIDTYWRKGHILGTDRAFFAYEHVLPEGVTYVLSENEGGQIDAILGYIPYGKTHRDIMTVMWKANHTAHPSLGLALLQFLKENGDIRIIASPGSNKKLAGVYRYLGFQFEKMTAWYRLRAQENYHLAQVTNRVIPAAQDGADYLLLPDWTDVEKHFDFSRYSPDTKPYKEPCYIEKRYFCHPVYCYEVYGVRGADGKAQLLAVFRTVSAQGATAVKLIDCIGDFTLMNALAGLLDHVLDTHQAEYVDCYEAGIPEEAMKASGCLKTEDSGNIIPNYFAPFTQENVGIWYFSSDPDIVLFRGDGDQDRPNLA